MKALSTSFERAQLEGYRIEKIRAGMEDEMSFLCELQVFAWVKQELVSQNAEFVNCWWVGKAQAEEVR
eukprot:4508931-Heterocapsa_arctica.AAC.1